MKTRILNILLFVCIINLHAQDIDYNTIILPDNAANVDFADKLVQIAWKNNPENEILRRNIRISKHNLNLAKWSWLDNFSVQGNFNEGNVDPPEEAVNRFFPRYNLGARITLGFFVNTPQNTKIAREHLRISEESLNSRKLEIRSEVLRRYQEYLTNQALLKIQSQVSEDSYASFSLVEERFKNGEASLNEYNRALQDYNNQESKKVIARNQFIISKIDLEELIGVKLESIN